MEPAAALSSELSQPPPSWLLASHCLPQEDWVLSECSPPHVLPPTARLWGCQLSCMPAGLNCSSPCSEKVPLVASFTEVSLFTLLGLHFLLWSLPGVKGPTCLLVFLAVPVSASGQRLAEGSSLLAPALPAWCRLGLCCLQQ